MKATPETATGLRIECEQESEILSHLSTIRQSIRKVLKENNNEVTDTIELEDSNCYGSHIVIINLNK